MSLQNKPDHCDGKDCECMAYSSHECGCNADWTTEEVYRLRDENARLTNELEALKREIEERNV